jgi:hypothetical protein
MNISGYDDLDMNINIKRIIFDYSNILEDSLLYYRDERSVKMYRHDSTTICIIDDKEWDFIFQYYNEYSRIIKSGSSYRRIDEIIMKRALESKKLPIIRLILKLYPTLYRHIYVPDDNKLVLIEIKDRDKEKECFWLEVLVEGCSASELTPKRFLRSVFGKKLSLVYYNGVQLYSSAIRTLRIRLANDRRNQLKTVS